MRKKVSREAVLYLCLHSRGGTVIFLHILKIPCLTREIIFFFYYTGGWILDINLPTQFSEEPKKDTTNGISR